MEAMAKNARDCIASNVSQPPLLSDLETAEFMHKMDCLHMEEGPRAISLRALNLCGSPSLLLRGGELFFFLPARLYSGDALEDHLLVLIQFGEDMVPGGKAAEEKLFGQRVFDVTLNSSAERPRA